MATFSYKAKRGPREHVNGIIDAADRSAALEALSADGLFVTDLKESRRKKVRAARPSRLSDLERTEFLSLLAAYTSGGVEIVDTLEAIRASAKSDAMHDLADDLASSLRRGMPFQEAAARKPFVFGRVATALIAGGEKSGRLNEMLAVIAGYAAKERAARSTAVEALAYPVFVLFAAGCAVSFMMTVAVPRFTEAFASSGAILPWPTRVLIAASSFLASYGVWCVAACVCAAAAAWRSLRDPRRRDRVLERCVRLPFLGPLILEPAVLNVYRALAAMATGGVPLFDAVTAAAPAAGLSLVEADARIVAERIQQGFSFSGALAKTRYLKDFYPAIAAHGERTGDIARAFSAIVRELERGIAARCAVASRLIEPAVIVIVGLFIGAVVTAMALPVMTMSQLVR